jgi:hypothetical protein
VGNGLFAHRPTVALIGYGAPVFVESGPDYPSPSSTIADFYLFIRVPCKRMLNFGNIYIFVCTLVQYSCFSTALQQPLEKNVWVI